MSFTFSKFHNVTKTLDKQILLVNPSKITAGMAAETLSPCLPHFRTPPIPRTPCETIRLYRITALTVTWSRLPRAQHLPHTAQESWLRRTELETRSKGQLIVYQKWKRSLSTQQCIYVYIYYKYKIICILYIYIISHTIPSVLSFMERTTELIGIIF